MYVFWGAETESKIRFWRPHLVLEIDGKNPFINKKVILGAENKSDIKKPKEIGDNPESPRFYLIKPNSYYQLPTA